MRSHQIFNDHWARRVNVILLEEDEKQNKVKADSRILLFNLQEKKTNWQNVDIPNTYRAHKIENTNNSRENGAKEMELTEKEMQMLLPRRKIFSPMCTSR